MTIVKRFVSRLGGFWSTKIESFGLFARLDGDALSEARCLL